MWRQALRVIYGAVVFAVLGSAYALSGPAAISLKSSTLSAFAGNVFTFEIRLQPDASDRWIALAFEPDIVGNGAWTIDGAGALPVYQMKRRLTVPGVYHVAAAVGHGNSPRAVSTLKVLVVGN